MLLIPFLTQRQIGTKSCFGFRASDYRLNLDSLLSRFICSQKDVFTVHGEDMEVPPFACKFRKDVESDLLAVANEDGHILLYNTSDGFSKAFIKSFTAHNNAIFDICWLPHKCELLTASGDHHASLWDINTCKFITTFKSHTASVKSVDVCPTQSAVFATGSRDGNICVWDAREHCSTTRPKPAISIVNAHDRKNPQIVSGKRTSAVHTKDVTSSVSCVAFQDCNNLASAGVADGIVKIWDMRKTYLSKNKSAPLPRYQMSYCGERFSGHGCTSLVFDSVFKKLYACSTGNKIYQFDCHSYSNEALTYEGFRCSTYFIKMALSCNDQYLLCGSSDDKAYIWKAGKPGLPIFELPGHCAEVTSVAWSPYTMTKLVTCGDDNKILVWRISSDQSFEQDETTWSCSPYSEGSNEFSPLSNEVICPKFGRRLSLPEPQTLDNPVLVTITNFFSPVTSSSSAKPHQDSFVSNSLDENKLNLERMDMPTSSKILVSNVKSSCSKILNDRNTLEATPCKDVLDTNFRSEKKRAETAPPVLCSGVQDKENEKKNKIQNISSDRSNILAPTKRKLSFHQSTPKFRRTASRVYNKEKNSNKATKKQKLPPGKTIRNYFSVSISPEN